MIHINRAGSNLGMDVATQVLRQPRPLFIAGGVIGAFGLFPGLPKPPFLLLAVLLIGLGFGLRCRRRPTPSRRPCRSTRSSSRSATA